MFAPHHVMEPVPQSSKRYGSSLRSLPPIETLQPETLKDFTKDDLRCYLDAAGITPGITKPEMKRQMRSLINQINGIEEGSKRFNTPPPNMPMPMVNPMNPLAALNPMNPLAAMNPMVAAMNPLVAMNPGFPTAAFTQPTFPVQYIPQPTLPPPVISTGGGGLPNFAEGDIQCTDCQKKGNKECQHKRCRTCCLKKMQDLGYRCGPHLRDSDRRPIKPGQGPLPGTPVSAKEKDATSSTAPTPATSTPSTPSTPTPAKTQPAYPASPTIQRSATMPPPPPRYPSMPTLPPAPSMPTPVQPVMNQYTQPNYGLLQTLQPPSPMEPAEVSPYSVAECPRCHKVVSTLGANLWLHLKECDPDHIMDYVRLLHEGKLATPTLTEKEKNDPLRIAHQNATQRYQQNIAYLQEIFSSTSVDDLIEWHAKKPSRESEEQRAVDMFTQAMEKMTGILSKHDNFLDTFKTRSESFYNHLQLLDTCTSLEEVTKRTKEFERDLDLRVGPVPVAVRVANDTARRNGVGASDIAMSDDAGATTSTTTSSKGKEKDDGHGSGMENGKHCISMYDKEMVDVSEAPPLSLVAL